ncbi:hypothetical protein AwPolaro_08900 [Polaromonas sp.]|nr:hypothetical protein AwPolaro_08900 [Polaromonas sp.]
MSESDKLLGNANETPAEPRPELAEDLPSPGTLLRQAREAAGVHLASLAASLKVPIGRIEALEQDQFHLLPDAVFTRALAGSVCRMLKLDPAPILERLPAGQIVQPVVQNRGINESFRIRNVSLAATMWGSISRPAVLAGIVLLMGALVMVFLPSLRQGDAATDSESSGAQTDERATPALPEILNETPVVLDAESAALTPVVASSAATAASATVSPAAAPASASASSAASSAGLSFRTTGPSWISVTDAKGLIVFNRTLGAGEVADVVGVFPLTVAIGRVDMTQVQVRGKAFDLAAVAKNNIARFEVN